MPWPGSVRAAAPISPVNIGRIGACRQTRGLAQSTLYFSFGRTGEPAKPPARCPEPFVLEGMCDNDPYLIRSEVSRAGARGETENMRGWVSRFFGAFDTAAKVVGVIVVLLAALSFVLPPFGKWVDLTTARRFGALGFVYYEIDKDKAPTNDGQLFLLRHGSGLFEEIVSGDKLQAASAVNFREQSDNHSRPIFLLGKGDCVIVLARDRQIKVEHALSGGWLKVATTACGLFR